MSIKPPVEDPKIFDNAYGRIALILDPMTEASPIGTMVHLIAGASAMATSTPKIHTAYGAMPLGFWPIVVGHSGKGRKGTAWNLAERVMSPRAQFFFENHVGYGWETGLGAIQSIAENLDPDTGKVAPLLVVEEEMSKFIDALKKDRRYGSALTKAFDGRPIVYKTGKDDVRIPNPHLAYVCHMQPKLWKATQGSKDADGGTYNRFLPVWVERSKRVKMLKVQAGLEQAVTKCSIMFMQAATFGRSVSKVSVPDRVADVFEDHHRIVVEDLVNQSEEMSNYAERAMAYLLRTAALYALAEGLTEIRVKDFDSALELVKYSIGTLSYLLSGSKGFNGRTTLATKVLAFVKQHGPCTFTFMTKKIGRGNVDDRGSVRGAFLAAIHELDGEVVLYEAPKPPDQRGPAAMCVAMRDSVPLDATILDLSQVDPEDTAEGSPGDAPSFKVTVTVNRDHQADGDEPEEAEVVDESETPVQPLKALPGPKPPKAATRPSAARTAPPTDHATPNSGVNGRKVTPSRARRPRPAADTFDPSSW